MEPSRHKTIDTLFLEYHPSPTRMVGHDESSVPLVSRPGASAYGRAFAVHFHDEPDLLLASNRICLTP